MKNMGIALLVVAALGFALAGCGGKRSGSGIEILNVEFFGDGQPTIRLIDPNEGIRTVHVGEKVNGLTVLGADENGVTFLGLDGDKVYVKSGDSK